MTWFTTQPEFMGNGERKILNKKEINVKRA